MTVSVFYAAGEFHDRLSWRTYIDSWHGEDVKGVEVKMWQVLCFRFDTSDGEGNTRKRGEFYEPENVPWIATRTGSVPAGSWCPSATNLQDGEVWQLDVDKWRFRRLAESKQLWIKMGRER